MSAAHHPAEQTIPTLDELARSTAKLTPILAARGGEGDASGRIADDLIEQIAEAGVFKTTQPIAFGGYGYTGAASCVVTEQIARGDGSAAWVVFNLLAGGWTVGVMSNALREEVWGKDANARVCTVQAPRGQARKVPGGYRLSGKWAFASGCLHAQWTTLGGVVLGDDGTMQGVNVFVVPMQDLQIHVDWDVGGFRGTGSNTLILKDVFVPEHRTGQLMQMVQGINPFDGERPATPYYNTGLSSLFTVGIFGTILGLGEAVIDAFAATLPGREVAYSQGTQAESEIVQLHLARLRLALHSMRQLSAERNKIVDDTALAGTPLAFEEKSLLRASVSYAARLVLEEAQHIMADAGGRGLAEAGRLPRILRDLQALNNHGLVNPFQVLAAYGATTLGLTPKMMLG
ncbi:acyl-CoA dehydrogenase family protein [Acidocella sp.]|uniref:acyl-CoA dehydrogenase family protein n=1 Tax=Acidocella sp. TaxID=50710 RepID=UPI0026279E60|nr:acyl-CoA dehydrogenase family protein [Acidocella sp.]